MAWTLQPEQPAAFAACFPIFLGTVFMANARKGLKNSWMHQAVPKEYVQYQYTFQVCRVHLRLRCFSHPNDSRNVTSNFLVSPIYLSPKGALVHFFFITGAIVHTLGFTFLAMCLGYPSGMAMIPIFPMITLVNLGQAVTKTSRYRGRWDEMG